MAHLLSAALRGLAFSRTAYPLPGFSIIRNAWLDKSAPPEWLLIDSPAVSTPEIPQK